MRTCFPCYNSPSKISSFISQENTDAPELRMERRGKINEELIKEPSVSSCAPARDSGGAGNRTPARPPQPRSAPAPVSKRVHSGPDLRSFPASRAPRRQFVVGAESDYLAASGNHPPLPRGTLPAFLALCPLDSGSSIYGEKGLLNSRSSHFPGKVQPCHGDPGFGLLPSMRGRKDEAGA